MQFYQKRDFGMFISDTFAFFKDNGKNYFKNYILINGLLLIFLVVIVIFGYKELFSQIFDGNLEGQNYFFETYFQENQVMLILVSLLVFFLFMAVSMVSYSYPVLYMKRLSETRNPKITTDQILGDLKDNIGRFLILFLGLIFAVTPLAMVLVLISYVLILVLVGIVLLFLLIPVMMNVVNFLMFDYFHTKKGFFESLSYAIRAQFSYPNGREKSPFWKYWGSTTVMYFIVQTITSIFTMIPMIIIFVNLYTNPVDSTKSENPFSGTMGIMFFAIYGVSLVMSFLLMNLIYVNSGLQYYDSRTDLHRNLDMAEIDTIGTNEV